MTLHTKLSLLKSALRIVGYAYLLWDVIIGVIILIVAEGLGIAEELWPNAYKGTDMGAEPTEKIDRVQAFLCWLLRCHKPTWGCWRDDGRCCICYPREMLKVNNSIITKMEAA
jgi:hypothetical protein